MHNSLKSGLSGTRGVLKHAVGFPLLVKKGSSLLGASRYAFPGGSSGTGDVPRYADVSTPFVRRIWMVLKTGTA